MLRNILYGFLLMTALAPALPAEPAPTPESQLLLPFFEVSLEGLERMTFFSIVNSSSEPIELTATVYTNWAIPIHEVRMTLEPKQAKPVNLHDWIIEGKMDNGDSVCASGVKDCLDLLHIQQALAGKRSPMTDLYYSTVLEEGVATGFVTFKADNGFLPESDVLWGDYFYTDPIENFAQGERLVRLEPDLACADLCFRHSVRFLEGGAFTGGTKLTVWSWDGVPNEPSQYPNPQFQLDQATLDVYNQQGDLVATIPKDVLPVQSIVVGEDDDLKVAHPFGWFDISTFRVSSVSGLYRAASRFSVGVPAWCLPCDPCNENAGCYDPTNRDCKCFPAHLALSGDSAGRVGQPFSLTYNLTGSRPINVRVRHLPAGLTQHGRTIEGTPTAEGTFTISADNQCGDDEISVTIGPPDVTIDQFTYLTLRKVVTGGGPYDADGFTLYFTKSGVRQNVTRDVEWTFELPDEFASITVKAGEDNRDGYSAGVWTGDCAANGNVTLHAGDHKECTITNTYTPPARIKLIKHVINDDGGTAVPSDFPLFLNGQQVQSGAVTEVPPGAYTASEQNLSGYTPGSWGGDCAANGSVSLAAGDFKVCEITNDDQPAMITLVKYVSGGTAQVSDFPLFVGGTRVTSSVSKKMAPGVYTASEQTFSGYTGSAWSGDCAADGRVTLALGDNKRCEITNTYTEMPTLTLIKHVVNDDGGTAQVSDFALYVDSTRVTSGQSTILAAGNYQASEQSLPGYAASSWSGDCAADGRVTLAAGDHKVCHVTNDDRPATITLIKHVSGGPASVGDFNLYVSGTQVTSGVAKRFAPGTYTASEQSLPNYQAGSWSGDCAANGSVTLALGENKVCEITNTYTCDPDPDFSISNASVDFNDPHQGYHHTEVRFNWQVGGAVNGKVQLFWQNGSSTYIKKEIAVNRQCGDAPTEGNLFWQSDAQAHHPGHGAKYFARLVIGNQVVESIALN